jgi:hypothetical protein
MLHETVVLREGLLLTIDLGDDLSYTLRYGELVEYSNRGRRVRGRALPYSFRSVEQLSYDFEADVRRVEEGA